MPPTKYTMYLTKLFITVLRVISRLLSRISTRCSSSRDLNRRSMSLETTRITKNDTRMIIPILINEEITTLVPAVSCSAVSVPVMISCIKEGRAGLDMSHHLRSLRSSVPLDIVHACPAPKGKTPLGQPPKGVRAKADCFT